MSKTVLITGASRGIGRAIAKEFAKLGWHLILLCRNQFSLLEQLKEELSGTYAVSCELFSVDVSSFEEVSKLYQDLDALGLLPHILVNNAGISHIGLLTEMSKAQWDDILGTNLSGVFHTCRFFAPEMIRRGQGKIINISSVWGCSGASCEVAYSATKGGVNAFTKALAKELAPSNIQVNAIACGAIETEMNAFLSEEEKSLLTEEIPSGRFGQPAEVARLVVDLSTGHEYLTGQIIKLDGAWI